MMKDRFLIWLWKYAKEIRLYSAWVILLIPMAVYFYSQLTGDDKTILIQGKTSNGHYQIEEKCDLCHEGNLKDDNKSAMQGKCLDCHKEKITDGTKSNTHSVGKLKEKPALLKNFKADLCVTCHKEHQLGREGVAQPVDFCIHCHENTLVDQGDGEYRVSHKSFSLDGCNECHHYHNNSVNYSEDFLAKHLAVEPITKSHSGILKRQYNLKKIKFLPPLTWDDHDATSLVDLKKGLEWDKSSHALAGVNCLSCHKDNKDNKVDGWTDKPNHQACSSCHKNEVKGFLSGKHGMRLKDKLPSMTTGKARLPMKRENKELNCISCHKDHEFDVKEAAVEGCLNCHNDEHSLAYKETKHYQLWKDNDELGVSCATCHMPKVKEEKGNKKHRTIKSVLTQHNQNQNLRPNQIMAKNVCTKCHGLGFSIDALQNKQLINNNFATPPSKHIPLIEMWNEYNNKN